MLTETIAILVAALQAGGQSGAAAAPARPAVNLDEVICRAAEPILGSRVARRRVCRTRAEWQAFEDDRAQLRRDIQNAAKTPPLE
jgi:hypothetical protein